MKEIKNIVVFNSLVKHGSMSEEENLKNFAKEIGYQPEHFFMGVRNDENHPYIPGTSYTISLEDVANYDDLYQYVVWADTIKLTRKTPGVVVGFNCVDGANIIAMNLKTQEVTSTYCNGNRINQGVPFTIASHLGGNSEDIMVNISPFTYLIPYISEKGKEKPKYISNVPVWEDCLMEKDGILYIDQKKALMKQLVASGIKEENIDLGENILTNNQYYSQIRNRLTIGKTNSDCFMHGVMYEREGQEKDYHQSYVKKYSVR